MYVPFLQENTVQKQIQLACNLLPSAVVTYPLQKKEKEIDFWKADKQLSKEGTHSHTPSLWNSRGSAVADGLSLFLGSGVWSLGQDLGSFFGTRNF